MSTEIQSEPGLPTPEGCMSIEIQSKPGLPTPEGSHIYRNTEYTRITDPGGVACLQKYRVNLDYRPVRARLFHIADPFLRSSESSGFILLP